MATIKPANELEDLLGLDHEPTHVKSLIVQDHLITSETPAADVRAFGAVGDGSTDDRAAIAAVTDNDLFFPSGTYRIASALSLSGKRLRFAEGAKLSPSSGTTIILDSNCIVEAGDAQVVFDGAGDVKYETHGRVSVNWWGANGTTDFGLRINEAVANSPNARRLDHYADGQIIQTPVNYTRSVLNNDAAGNSRKPWLFYWGFFQFDLATGTECVFDTTGTRFLRMVGLRANRVSDANQPKVGIFRSRESDQASISGFIGIDLHLSGSFTVAGYFNHAGEVEALRDCRFDNVNTGATACGGLITRKNSYGVTSPYTTALGNTNLSNSTHILDNIVWRGDGGNGAFFLDGGTGLTGNMWFVEANGDNGARAYVKLASSTGSIGGLEIAIATANVTGGATLKPDHVVEAVGLEQAKLELKVASSSFVTDYAVLASSGHNVLRDTEIHSGSGIFYERSSGTDTFNVDWDVSKVKGDGGAVALGNLTGEITIDSFADFEGVDKFSGTLRIRDEKIHDVSKHHFRAGTQKNVTISSGVITLASDWMRLTSESGTSDDLDTISLPANWSVASSGLMVDLFSHGSHTITIKHGTGNILLQGGSDKTVNANSGIRLRYDGSNWIQVI